MCSNYHWKIISYCWRLWCREEVSGADNGFFEAAEHAVLVFGTSINLSQFA